MLDDCSIVVVSSGHRSEWLQRCLDSLKNQSRPAREIICVSMTQETRLMKDPRIRFVFEPRRGASLARNLGWRLAEGEIVAFTDDDCVARHDWLESLTPAFGDPEIACVAGRVESLGGGLWHAATPDSSPRRCYRQIGDLRWPWDPGSGNNMAYRRDVLQDLGGFDERLGPGSPFASAEDLDLFVRSLFSGHSILHLPEARVSHEPLADFESIRRSTSAYRYGLGALFAKTQHKLGRGLPDYLLETDGRILARALLHGDNATLRFRAFLVRRLFQGFLAWQRFHGPRT